MGTVHCLQLQLSSVADATMATAAKYCSPLLVKEPSNPSDLPSRAHSGPSSDHLGAVGRLLYSARKEEWKVNWEIEGRRRGHTKARAALALQIRDSIKAHYLIQ